MKQFSAEIVILNILIIFLQKSSACEFKCPSSKYTNKLFLKIFTFKKNSFTDSYPFPNPHSIKSANGCGTSEINLEAKYLPNPHLEYCCNQHDYCYETCGVSKEYCDMSFRKCMTDVCRSGFYPLKCKLHSKIFFGIAKNLGCKSYLKSQEKACICH